jgi:iron complex outermembrane receptor protein
MMAATIAPHWRGICSTIAIAASMIAAVSASAQDRPSDSAKSRSDATSTDKNDPDYQSDDIIVTASKRSERLQDVPGAVSAISGAQIDNLGIKSFQDYVALVPGLSQRDGGTPGSGTIILRGLNTGPQQLTNTTAYYIDETPFSASGFISQGALITPEPELADVDQIEVLKGPQGTLYGASNLGGLIKLVTKRPDTTTFKGEAYADATAVDGGGEGFTLRGAVNVPIVNDVLAVRVNGFYRRTPGFTDNVGTGTQNVNKSDFAGGRIGIRFTPTDKLTIDLDGFYQDIDSKGFAFTDDVTGTLTPKYGRYKYSNYADLPTKLQYRIANATAEYKTDLGTLTASASYARYKTFISSDATPIFGPLVAPNSRVLGDLSPNTKKFSSEIRFASRRVGPAEFVVGAFYTDEDSRYRSYYTVSDSTGAPLPAPFNVLVRTDTLSKYKEVAGFGNLTFYLTDKFDITGGVRYAHNTQVGVTGAPSDAGSAVIFYTPRAAVTYNFSDSSTSLLGTIRWRPSSNVSLFVRAAQGYRPGGPQTNLAPPPGAQTQIRPDTVWNYEAGLKAKTSDGSLAVDLSVYHIDWKDIQLNTNYNNIILQSNGGDAKVDGAEAEITARPSSLLTFTANIGYTNARISRVDPGVSLSIGVANGDKLPLTPRFTAAFTGDQKIVLGDKATAFVGATLRFRSDMPSGYPGSASDPSLKIPDMTTVDVRTGVTLSRFDIRLIASNIFNTYGITSSGNSPYRATVIRPRAITLSVGARF